MPVVLHGIDNCDQCRKARHWLQARGLSVRLHDLRRDGLDRRMLERWLSHLPWDALVNRRGQSWRKLDESRRRAIVDRESLIELLLAEPLLVKRPVLEAGNRLLLGFSEAAYDSAFPATASDGYPAA